MKLSEILKKLDKSKKNERGINSYNLCQELGLNFYWVDTDDRLKCYYITKWCCTDSYVGLKAYYLDDILVCISHKSARKSNENFDWVSVETKDNVRKYLTSLVETEEEKVEGINFDEDLGEGFFVSFSEQLLADEVTYLPTGEKAKVVKRFGDFDNWKKVEININNSSTNTIVPLTDILVPFCIVE